MTEQIYDSECRVAATPPGWWPVCDSDVPLFVSQNWLKAFADVRSYENHYWFRATEMTTGRESMIRGTWVDDSRLRRSLNPHHWMFEQTAYRDGVAFTDAQQHVPIERVIPSLVFVYPGLDFHLVGNRDARAVTTLFGQAIRTAKEAGAASVAIGFAQPGDGVTAEVALQLGFTRFKMATLASYHVAGRSADDLFGSYSRKQRASFRRTRRRLGEQGVKCRILQEPHTQLDLLTELRCSHLAHHGRSPIVQEERRHLAALFLQFGALVTVLIAVRDHEIRAFSLFLQDGDTWHSYMTGRREACEDRDVYFELNYYLPVEIAARNEYRVISYGYGTEEAKRLRGCQLEDVYGYVMLLHDTPTVG